MADRLTRNVVVRSDDFPTGAVCMFEMSGDGAGWAVIATDEHGHILTRADDEFIATRAEADAAYAEWVYHLGGADDRNAARDQVIDQALGKGEAA